MKLRSKLALLLALVMVVALLLPACGAEKVVTDPTTSTTSTATVPTVKKHLEISMLGVEMATFGKDRVGEKIQKDLDITIVPTGMDWGDANQTVKLAVSAGTPPDVFFTDDTDIPWLYSWIDQGIIRDIPESFINKYPLAAKQFAPDATCAQMSLAIKQNKGDKFYTMPVSFSATNDWKASSGGSGQVYRKDWLANVGATVPTNMDELYNVGKLFTTKDPDKNGKNDTYGFLTNQNPGAIYQIYGIDTAAWVLDETDGQVKPAFLTNKMIEPLKWLNKAYNEKLIDPEMMTNANINKYRAKFAQNLFGFLWGNGDVSNINGMVGKAAFAGANNMNIDADEYKDQDKLFSIVGLMPPLKVNATSTTAYWAAQTDNSFTCVSKGVDDEKLDRIVELYDYLLKPEIADDLLTGGFVDETYKLDAQNRYVFLPNPATGANWAPATDFPSGVIGYFATWNKDILYRLTNKAPKLIEAVKANKDLFNQCTLVKNDLNLTFLDSFEKNRITYDMVTDLGAVITASKPVEETFKALQDAYAANGMTAASAEVTRLAKEKGFIK